ncbi:MAG: TetR/AcrR family transcriptional regulator [Solirubrobacterales bacterium]
MAVETVPGERTDARARPEIRAAILERAVDIASRDGLEGLTIGRLAGELEMSKSGLFRHFGSKEELQLATVAEAAEMVVEEVVNPALSAEEGEPRLRALCEHYIDHLEREVLSGGCFWGATSAEFDDRPGPVRDAIRDAVAAWSGALARQAELAGFTDPEQLSFELQAIAQGANSAYRLFGDERAFTRARRAFERLLP